MESLNNGDGHYIILLLIPEVREELPCKIAINKVNEKQKMKKEKNI